MLLHWFPYSHRRDLVSALGVWWCRLNRIRKTKQTKKKKTNRCDQVCRRILSDAVASIPSPSSLTTITTTNNNKLTMMRKCRSIFLFSVYDWELIRKKKEEEEEKNDRFLSGEKKKKTQTNKQTNCFSCGLSRFNLCMPFVYSDRSCQTLAYTCTESCGCPCCWPWDWLKQTCCSEQVRPF